MIISIQNSSKDLTIFDQVHQKRKTRFKKTISKEDVRSKAIRLANDHIQNGDFSVIYSAQDNPILDNSAKFTVEEYIVSEFDQD